MNDLARAKLEAATSDAEDVERLKEELARREDEFGRAHLELDDMRRLSSALRGATPRYGGSHSFEPPSYVSSTPLGIDRS